ncbi:MAG TPA: hypothetical protein VG672_16690 [Bryobacteraceae bacterium]|nr:hypothetical protein [Bryobacteraceae bacterium]
MVSLFLTGVVKFAAVIAGFQIICLILLAAIETETIMGDEAIAATIRARRHGPFPAVLFFCVATVQAKNIRHVLVGCGLGICGIVAEQAFHGPAIGNESFLLTRRALNGRVLLVNLLLDLFPSLLYDRITGPELRSDLPNQVFFFIKLACSKASSTKSIKKLTIFDTLA